MDIKRGGKTEQSTTFDLREGKNLVQFESTFSKNVRWNEKKNDKGELIYQEKFMTVTMYGTTQNGVQVVLGKKEFEISNHVHKVKDRRII